MMQDSQYITLPPKPGPGGQVLLNPGEMNGGAQSSSGMADVLRRVRGSGGMAPQAMPQRPVAPSQPAAPPAGLPSVAEMIGAVMRAQMVPGGTWQDRGRVDLKVGPPDLALNNINPYYLGDGKVMIPDHLASEYVAAEEEARRALGGR